MQSIRNLKSPLNEWSRLKQIAKDFQYMKQIQRNNQAFGIEFLKESVTPLIANMAKAHNKSDIEGICFDILAKYYYYNDAIQYLDLYVKELSEIIAAWSTLIKQKKTHFK